MQIFDRIKKLRKEKNLTQDEMAKRMGTVRTTYAYWETVNPTLDKLDEIAKALGVTRQYLLNDDNFVADKSLDEKKSMISVDYLAGQLDQAERLIAEKEARRLDTERRTEELKGDKQVLQHIIDKQFNLIEGCIRDVGQDTWRVLVYQHAWVEFFSETLSGGDKKKKTELMERMGKMLNDRLEAANKAGKGQGAGKARKEDKRES